MSATSPAAKTARAERAPLIGAKSAVHDPSQFWAIEFKRQTANPQTWKRAFHVLPDRMMASPGVNIRIGYRRAGSPHSFGVRRQSLGSTSYQDDLTTLQFSYVASSF